MNIEEKTEEKFYKFHKHLVDEVIKFCKENDLTNIEQVDLSIDNLGMSIKTGEWSGATDSSLTFYDHIITQADIHDGNIEPYLKSI